MPFLTTIFSSLSSHSLSALSFSPRDAVDVLFIAFLVFAVIRLLQETRSASVVVGVLVFSLLYGFALAFNLPLSSLVFRSFFGTFLVIIAIMFQRELRRFFSFFGVWGVRHHFRPLKGELMDVIARAAAQLARQRTGALIVLPGRETIERAIEGGWEVNGEISEPLLFSIFDTSSPGHDGAVIIDENRLKRFGAHLPLSERAAQLKQFGLRHRAALGMSERSDAFVIVVSEERATIQVARQGVFSLVDGEEELRRRLSDFYEEKFPGTVRVGAWRWLLRNGPLMLLSVFLAFGLWFVTNSRFAVVQRTFVVRPELANVSPSLLVNDLAPQEVVLTLQGRVSDFDALSPNSIRLVLDGKVLTRPGLHQVPVAPEQVSVPRGFAILKLDPSTLKIQVIRASTGTRE